MNYVDCTGARSTTKRKLLSALSTTDSEFPGSMASACVGIGAARERERHGPQLREADLDGHLEPISNFVP